MNFSEMQTEVRRRLNETSATYWTDADIKRALNDGYEEMAESSEFYERHTTMDLLSGRTYYDLRYICEDTFISPRRIQNNQTERWLTQCTVGDLEKNYVRWEDNQGEPERFFIRGTWWLGLWPQPDADWGSVRLYYSATPPAMVLDDDEPEFAIEYHRGLIEYAVYDLLAQQAETKKALLCWGMYQGYESALIGEVQGRMAPDRKEGLR